MDDHRTGFTSWGQAISAEPEIIGPREGSPLQGKGCWGKSFRPASHTANSNSGLRQPKKGFGINYYYQAVPLVPVSRRGSTHQEQLAKA